MLFMPLIGHAEINSSPLSVPKVRIITDPVVAGEAVKVELQWQLASGHHAYLDQFRLHAPKDSLPVTLQDVQPVIEFSDKFSKKKRKGVKGQGTIIAVLELPKNFPMGFHTVDLSLTYQACSSEYCLLPKDLIVPIEIHIDKGGTGATLPFNVNEGWRLWLLVFLAGLLACLSPCVFPLIPITLGVLGLRTNQHSQSYRALLSLLYVLGIAFTYALLGIVAASTGALFGAFLGHPAVVLTLGILFLLIGFGALGWIDFTPPVFLQQKLATSKLASGLPGAFMAGVVAGLLASPCIGPVLAGLLAYVAQSQDLLKGFLLLFVFALGLGLPFLILGTFSHLLKFLPRAGRWMTAVKYIFAVCFWGLALFYLQPLVPGPWLYRLGALILAVAVVGEYFDQDIYKSNQRWLQGLFLLIIFYLSGVFWVAHWWPVGTLHVREAQKGQQSEHPVSWVEYSEAVLMRAQQEQKPVIIDFYADWCVACKELENLTFTDQQVQLLKEKFVWVRYDATQPDAEFTKQQQKYGIVGLPHLVFINSSGKVREDLTLRGFEEAEPFVNRLRALLEKNP